ncbi:SAND domain-containing protein [Artemisia annua]|uniref:SAND domain-containing protein n=1 Tax=Artemisia annua TaxID=35608 RepID=A0A2U1QH07_ARTAN|nr:SAND domain-containing protein [Artemisia annua]
MADGTMMFSEEEVKEMCGFKFCGDGHVEVTCGCTSYCYGDAVGILKVFINGDLEIVTVPLVVKKTHLHVLS